ncbi:MAG TPA: hypothetical protein PL167_02730 [Cyclobacteriaceae bacterium]|nr:hypothetical protein [Cyclobacteriaceae bacterium]
MGKIILTYVSIFCLLILVMANTITTSIKTKTVATNLIDWNEEETDKQTNPPPAEEDNSGLDDETSKLTSLYTLFTVSKSTRSIIFSNHFLTSFHFLEIISPPPQA